jgi:acyl-coenzyme A synthetase/AMP-(fatty) acid ligase
MLLQRLGNRGIDLGTLFDRAARRDPMNVVVLDHDLDTGPDLGRRVTTADLAEHVADLASALWAAGVRPTERVVVHKANSADIPLLACACARIGAVPVLLSPYLDGETVAELVRRVGRPHLLTDAATLTGSLPASIADDAAQVLLASGADARATRLADHAGGPRVAPVPMSPDQPTLLTHTSGTTGIPKLAVHTSRTLQARFRPQWAAAAMVPGRERVAMHVSFVHSRLFTAMAIALLRGCPMIVMAEEDPEAAAELFATYRPGVLEAHPNSFMRWESLAGHPDRPLSSVCFFSSTFDALHPRTVQTLLGASDRRRARFAQLYGQSEVGPVVGWVYGRGASVEGGRCVGRPFPGMTDVRVVSRDGSRPSADNPGYIEVSTDGRIVTYLGEQERYDAQVHDGWWRMGDLGYRDRFGRLHLLDREVDEIPGFGSTLAVEDALFARVPSLAEVIIVPIGDGRTVPVVCTKDDEPLDEGTWAEATGSLPAMEPPVHWRLADLPQTATTKIKRLELARRLSATAA